MALSKREIQQLPSFVRLSECQKTFVLTYVETGGNRDAAAKAAFSGKPESIRTIGYLVLSKPHVRKCIDEAMQMSRRDQFMRDLDDAIRNPKLTMAQVHALVAKGRALRLIPRDYAVGGWEK